MPKGVKGEAGLMKKSYCQWERNWLFDCWFYPYTI